MQSVRVALVVVVVVLWGLFVPAAMAADHCAAMSGMCEGPCGASSTVTAPALPTLTGLVGRAPAAVVPVAPQPERSTPEQPPRSPLLSV
jgi:hypothetical protein